MFTYGCFSQWQFFAPSFLRVKNENAAPEGGVLVGFRWLNRGLDALADVLDVRVGDGFHQALGVGVLRVAVDFL